MQHHAVMRNIGFSPRWNWSLRKSLIKCLCNRDNLTLNLIHHIIDHFLNRVKIMQTSDQSSEPAAIPNHIQETHSSSNDLPDQLERQKSDNKAADNEAIRRGLIYPP